MKKLEEFERKEEEKAARERAKQEMIIAEAKEAAKKQEEEELKKRLVAEAEREKYEKDLKEKKKKEEEDRIFTARLKDMYLAQGYSEESIEIMIQDAENKKIHGSHSSHSPHSPHAFSHHDNAIVKIEDHMKVVDLGRPTYIKVHRKHLSPETLDAYGLPWEWYEVSPLFTTPPRCKDSMRLTFDSATPITLSSSDGSMKTTKTSCSSTRGGCGSKDY